MLVLAQITGWKPDPYFTVSQVQGGIHFFGVGDVCGVFFCLNLRLRCVAGQTGGDIHSRQMSQEPTNSSDEFRRFYQMDAKHIWRAHFSWPSIDLNAVLETHVACKQGDLPFRPTLHSGVRINKLMVPDGMGWLTQ